MVVDKLFFLFFCQSWYQTSPFKSNLSLLALRSLSTMHDTAATLFSSSLEQTNSYHMLSHQNKSVEKLESDLFAKKRNQRMCPSTVKRKACQCWDRLFAGKNLLDILLFGKHPGVGSALHVVSQVFVGGETGH